MLKKKTANKEFVSPGQELRESKKFSIKELIGGGILSREGVVRQIPFILFLFVILVFYIGNQYQGAKLMKKVVKLEARLKVLKTESISITFERMELSKQTEVKRMIEEKGLPLKQAVLPPYNIRID